MRRRCCRDLFVQTDPNLEGASDPTLSVADATRKARVSHNNINKAQSPESQTETTMETGTRNGRRMTVANQ